MKTKGYFVRFGMDDVNLLENSSALNPRGKTAVERIRNITHGYLDSVRRDIKVSRELWAKVMTYKEKHKEVKGESFEQIVLELIEKK